MLNNVIKLAVLLLCFVTIPSFAQEALIIKNNNDTLYGFIDYSEVLKTPKRITFSTAAKSEKQYFSPSQIKGFIIKSENLLYESAPIKVNAEKYKFESARMYDSLSQAIRDIRWREDTFFLLTLAKGKMNLYEYVDDNGESHFIIKKENGIYETLLNLKFKLRTDYLNRSNLAEAQISHYKTQLKILLSDCPTIEIYSKKLTYNSSTIQKLVNEYNEYFKNVVYTKPTMRYKPHFYVAAGVSKPRTRVIDYFGRENFFKSSLKPTLSLGMEFAPYSTQPLPKFGVAGIELNFFLVGTNDTVDIVFLGHKYPYNLKGLGINLFPYFQYNYKLSNTPTHRSAIYAKGGPLVSFYPSLSFNDERYSRMSFSANILVGFRLNRYFIEGRYEPRSFNILPPYLSTTYSQSRISLMGGYYF